MYEFPVFADVNDVEHELLEELKRWLVESYSKNRAIGWAGKHDEGTYLTSWREYYKISHDPLVRNYALDMLKKADLWIQDNYYHGYHKKQEVHHGVEHFIIFLAWILEIDPTNTLARRQLAEAANNIVIQGKKSRPWYDFDTNRFTSMYLGTKKSKKEGLNIVEHLRFVRLAWLGLYSGGDSQLDSFILNYSKEWAEEIVNLDELPLFLDSKSNQKNNKKFILALSKFMGAAPKEFTTKSRSEFHIANGVPDLMIDLYQKTGNKLYLRAAEKIIEPIIDQLHSTYAHPVGDLIWKLYNAGGLKATKSKLDDIVDCLYDRYSSFSFKNYKLSLEPMEWKSSPYKNCIGIRKDMLSVKLKGEKIIKIPSPSTFSLLSRLKKDPHCSKLAMEFALATFLESKKRYEDGRMHGCGSKSVSAYCVGHGRNWGAGYVSTSLRSVVDNEYGVIGLPK
jgi:hypothetical protein